MISELFFRIFIKKFTEPNQEKKLNMKHLLITIAVIIAFSACQECKKDDSLNNELERIENLLEKYMIAIENEDFQMIGNIWDEGDSTMMLGTDSHERLMGWANIRNAYQRQFDLIDDVLISVQDQYIRINCTGNTAWFSQRMSYNFMYEDVAHSLKGVRLTGVLVKNSEDQWKMVQGHLSVPAQVNIGR